MTTAGNWGDWVPDPGLVREVDSIAERAISAYRANPHLVTEHANQEESIRVGGYSNRTLLELVQNAADAMSGSSEHEEGAGRVEIVLDLHNDTLYCANAGRPFSKSGLTTLTHAHISGKRGDEIGRFGLGFKSVLAVTETPQVFSRSVSFEFNSDKAKAALRSVGASAARLPALRIATRLDAATEFTKDPVLAELAKWAVTVVRLPRASKLKNLKEEIEKFRSEFLLFVTAVREVRLRVIGEHGFSTSHVSRDLGDGRFRVERPNGDHEEWYVASGMHSPSPEARNEVGQAVSRDQMKVTVALPARFSQQRIGEFWSYFPLQDKTSASALFNAPWSVNDDRTTLLENNYNREILTTLSEMFVEILPRVVSADDPAAHLDYMPARGRETHSFGDGMLCQHIPRQCAKQALVPDSRGAMRLPQNLRPLDFAITDAASERDHEDWINSPNTGDDVPHWRCYSNKQRVARLRQLYQHSITDAFLEVDGRDELKALEKIAKRGVLSWLREWADGPDLASAVRALDFVLRNSKVAEISAAKVIPTTDGLRSLKDSRVVFLERVDDDDIEGASFVDPAFLEMPGVQQRLSERGFRDLDPFAVLQSRAAKLASDTEEESLPKFWEAAQNVSMKQAEGLVSGDKARHLKVPTRDGGWAEPSDVLDIEGLADGIPHLLLDHDRCVPQLAHSAGVITRPRRAYPVDQEIHFDDYAQHVLAELNRRLGPGERPVERIEFYEFEGPGPVSVLHLLMQAGAPERVRESWTTQLLTFENAKYWTCTDPDTGLTHRVISPVRWAVEQAGVLMSNRGYRPADQVVSASLVEYEAVLPLFRGARPVEDALGLPKDLSAVPADVLREALQAEVTNPIKNSALTGFILTASTIAFPDGRPPVIPARVGRVIESKRPASVYLATTEDERTYLSSKHKPHLRVVPEEADAFVEVVGCRRFEDSFSFSVQIDGQQAAEPVIDRYTGLRSTFVADKVMNATVTKAGYIAKRVTTENGVDDESLEWHLDGVNLVVRADFDERRVLEIVNSAFDLSLSNAELDDVIRTGVNQRLEEQRQSARAASSDAGRLDVYFGDDTLKENLPKGLWQALESQSLVDEDTSVSELFLTVYGSDSVKLLADEFRTEGYDDVPTTWAGGASAIAWLRKMGFGSQYAGRRTRHQDDEFVVPGAVKLNPLHDFQEEIRQQLSKVLTSRDGDNRARKGIVELPTGAGKTRVATETVLRLFVEGKLSGTVLWIAQSEELCEQAVQTFSTVWRWLDDERPLTIGRLWHDNVVHEPDTECSVVVATDAKLKNAIGAPEYEWLRNAAAVFVDEAHRAGGSTMYTDILRNLGIDGRNWERPLVGLTATPFKGNVERGEQTKALAARFGHYKMQAFDGNAYEELADMGVLARVEHRVLPGIDVTLAPEESRQVQSRRKLEPKVLDRIGRDQARMRILVNHILEENPEDWPILVFTPNVLSAQVLAATLRYRGREAAAISGQTGRQERRDVIKKFKDGKIQVLTNCDLLIQGFDAPGVRALYIARPTFSPSAYIQMAGRGLRGPQNGGKPECRIVDVADNFGAVNDFLGYKEYEKLWREQGA
ncbi:sacsin N-terminal ATP-binding-like domain-containing protein [Streptomyces sp. NPDC056600]|uniref:sacsin N-terminal ATP-binding-like domain-containing protein n=1 Tax=Streptomyces sp. NPDC056600 TaxID=3345874 RepID=UPI0036B2D792